MPNARDEAGNIWEVDAQGNPVRLVSAAGGPQMPANPAFPYQAPQAAANVQNTQANAVGQAIHNRVTEATAPAAIREAQAKAEKAELDAQAAAAEAATRPNPTAAKATKSLQLDEVLKAIDNARGEVSGWSTGLGGQLLQPIGGTQARDLAGDLSTIGSALTVDKLQQMKAQSSTGASGMGALSEKEGALLRDSVSSLDQARSPDKVRQSLDAIELHYRRLRAIQDGRDPDNEDVKRAYGIVTPGLKAPVVGGGSVGPNGGSGGANGPTPQGGNGGSGDYGLALATGGARTVIDPLRAGLNAKVADMVRAGKPANEIKSFLASAGVDPSRVTGIDEAVDFRRQYPSYKGDYPVDVETKQVPLGAVGSAINKLGQSAIGSYFANAADTLSAGTLDNMTSNPVATRAAMSAISDQHPYAALAGMATGGALASAGLEGGLGALGLKELPAAVASDAAFGSAYGAGSTDDGNRLAGAALGGLTGIAGGMFGRSVSRAAGGLARGVKDPAKRLLNDAGVRLSIPQMAGGTLKDLEDRLSGFPVVGSIVNGQRRRGLQDFQRAAFNEALAPIDEQGVGQIGEQGIQNAQDAVSQAFQNALGGVTVQADTPFKKSISDLAIQTTARPRVGPELASSIKEIAAPMFGPGGTLRGVDAQPIWQGLEQLKSSYRRAGDPLYATQVAPAIDAYGGQVEGLFQRQAPDVLPALRDAKTANRNVSILQDAVLSAQAKPGEMAGQFTPAQLMAASKNNAIKFSGRRSASAGRGGMFGLARAGNTVLPNTVPDSGTAGRLAMYGLLGGTYGLGDYSSQPEENRGIGGSTAKALAAASALALAARGGRPIVQKLAFGERSPTVEKLGQLLLDNPQFAAGASIPLLIPQQ